MYSEKNLIVDLDNSLIRTDILHESIILKLKDNLLSFIKIFLKAIKGKGYLKEYLAETTQINVQDVPVNKEVINLIKQYKENGYQIILLTGSHQIIADKVALCFNFFDRCYGSSKNLNLVGSKKLKFIQDNLKISKFAYIGDSEKDLTVWDSAQEVIFVQNRNKTLLQKIKKRYLNPVVIKNKSNIFPFLRLIRLHQWAKNLLLFVPSILAGSIFDIENLLPLVLGFISFSLIASSTYILNDILDLNSDRAHKSKCKRPLASGDISILTGGIAMFLLVLAGVNILLLLPHMFFLYLCTYVFLTLSYSFYFKKTILIDCIILSILYLVRLIIGSSITEDIISFWFVNFSFFFFLSLAFLKRYIEVSSLSDKEELIAGRAYQKRDGNFTLTAGLSSGIMSVLVFSLYLNDMYISEFNNEISLSWLNIPLLIFWISRIWFLSTRGLVDDDPVVFAIKDRISLIALISCFALFFLPSFL